MRRSAVRTAPSLVQDASYSVLRRRVVHVIHFQCPDCSAGLRVADEKAGKLTICPHCRRKVRAPARKPGKVEEVEELPVVEDEEEEPEMEVVRSAREDEDEEEDEEERPRARRRDEDDDDKPRRRLRSPPPPPEEEGRGDGEFLTRNRIMGVVGCILGLGFTVTALVGHFTGIVDVRNPLTTPYNAGGCFGLLLGVLMLAVGAIYAIRG
jgi:hypothetical protein